MKWVLARLLPVLMLPSCMTLPPAPFPSPWTDNYNTERDPEIALGARPYIIRRQACDHFRGEPPYSPERQTFLNDKMRETCTGTDAELQRLRAKYRDDPATVKALADFEDCIEYDSVCTETAQEN